MSTSARWLVWGSLLLGACARTATDVAASMPTTCPVHHVELTDALVPVEHGSLNDGLVPGYAAARADLFPNSVVPQREGQEHELTLEEHCASCTDAETMWLWEQFDGVIVTGDAWLPTCYVFAPGTRWPDADELPSCELHGAAFESVLSPTTGDVCGVPIPGYLDAQPEFFPNVFRSPSSGGHREIVFVAHCADCTRAERAWVEWFVGPASFHPFYAVPPGASALIGDAALAAEAPR